MIVLYYNHSCSNSNDNNDSDSIRDDKNNDYNNYLLLLLFSYTTYILTLIAINYDSSYQWHYMSQQRASSMKSERLLRRSGALGTSLVSVEDGRRNFQVDPRMSQPTKLLQGLRV